MPCKRTHASVRTGTPAASPLSHRILENTSAVRPSRADLVGRHKKNGTARRVPSRRAHIVQTSLVYFTTSPVDSCIEIQRAANYIFVTGSLHRHRSDWVLPRDGRGGAYTALPHERASRTSSFATGALHRFHHSTGYFLLMIAHDGLLSRTKPSVQAQPESCTCRLELCRTNHTKFDFGGSHSTRPGIVHRTRPTGRNARSHLSHYQVQRSPESTGLSIWPYSFASSIAETIQHRIGLRPSLLLLRPRVHHGIVMTLGFTQTRSVRSR